MRSGVTGTAASDWFWGLTPSIVAHFSSQAQGSVWVAAGLGRRHRAPSVAAAAGAGPNVASRAARDRGG